MWPGPLFIFCIWPSLKKSLDTPALRHIDTGKDGSMLSCCLRQMETFLKVDLSVSWRLADLSPRYLKVCWSGPYFSPLYKTLHGSWHMVCVTKCYMDGIQLYFSFQPDNPTVAAQISFCWADISARLREYQLQLNPPDSANTRLLQTGLQTCCFMVFQHVQLKKNQGNGMSTTKRSFCESFLCLFCFG